MNRVIYPKKKKYIRFDDNRFLVYLNEEVLDGYVPDDAPDTPAGTYYAYIGQEEDGGTMISANEANYEQFVAGLIRSRYSADNVEAILLNVQSGDESRMAEFLQELDDLTAFRAQCKNIASSLLE